MPDKPQFRYFLRHPATFVQENDAIWKSPLPMNRRQASVHSHSPSAEKQLPLSSGGEMQGDVSVSHGDYFCAIRSFLEKDRLRMISSEASRHIGQDTGPEHIESIDIYLEKHGQFYHPAKIETIVGGSEASFVLNVAISEPGKACIKREYNLLRQLNDTFSCSFLPKIYGQGEICVNNGPDIGMFMGEWFEGYCEFHISRDQEDKKNRIVVWDTEQGHFFLSSDRTMELYRQAAMILTCYYNVKTFEQICLWHHAAGDFVIKLDKEGDVGLKLITVRQYASLVQQGGGADAILHALMVFLVGLSLRMRLDRLDGVGDIVWADDIAVKGTVEGFFRALALKPAISLLPAPLSDCFQYYLSLYTETDIADLSEVIVNTYNPMAPEVPVMQKHKKNHAAALYHAIRS